MANYQVIAREMKGTSVTGYVLDNGSAKMRVDLDQMAFLVGRGLIDNCEGKIFRDTLIIGGINGLKLNKLPSIKSKDTDDNKLKGSYNVTDADINSEPEILYNITGIVKKGRVTVAYDTDTKGEVLREQVVKDAVDDKVGNLTTQMYNGSVLLRGVGINLKALPVRQIESKEDLGKIVEKKAEVKNIRDIILGAYKEVIDGRTSLMLGDFTGQATKENSEEAMNKYRKEGLEIRVVDFGGYDKAKAVKNTSTARVIIKQVSANRAEITIGLKVYGNLGKLKDRISNKFGLTLDIEANNSMIRANTDKLIKNLGISLGDDASRIVYDRWLELLKSNFNQVMQPKLIKFVGGDHTVNDASSPDKIDFRIISKESNGGLPVRSASFVALGLREDGVGKGGVLSCELIDTSKKATGNSRVEVDAKDTSTDVKQEINSVFNVALNDFNAAVSNSPSRENDKEALKTIQLIKKAYKLSSSKNQLKSYVGLKANSKLIESIDANSGATSYIYRNNMNNMSATFSVFVDESSPERDIKIDCYIDRDGEAVERDRVLSRNIEQNLIAGEISALIDEVLEVAKNDKAQGTELEKYRQEFAAMGIEDGIKVSVGDIVRYSTENTFIPLNVETSGKYVPLNINLTFKLSDEYIKFTTPDVVESSVKLAALLNKAVNRNTNQSYGVIVKAAIKKFVESYSKLARDAAKK